jgi:hypothetical protein
MGIESILLDSGVAGEPYGGTAIEEYKLDH